MHACVNMFYVFFPAMLLEISKLLLVCVTCCLYNSYCLEHFMLYVILMHFV